MATATVVTIERSSPVIRTALAEHAPTDEHRFEAEFRDALSGRCHRRSHLTTETLVEQLLRPSRNIGPPRPACAEERQRPRTVAHRYEVTGELRPAQSTPARQANPRDQTDDLPLTRQCL